MLNAKSLVVGDTRMIDQEGLQKIAKKTGVIPTGYHPDTGDDELNEQLKLVKVASTYDVGNKNFHIVPLPVKEQCSEESKKAVGKYDECCKRLHEWLRDNCRLLPSGKGYGYGAARCHWYDYFEPEGSDYQYLIAPNTLTRDGAIVSNHLGKVQFMQFSAKLGQVNNGFEPKKKFMYPPTSRDWVHSLEIVAEVTGREARHFILNTPFRVADRGCPDRMVDAFEQFIAICEESPLDVSGDCLAGRLEKYVRHSCGKSD